MSRKLTEEEWEEIIDEFKTYKGTINDFCIEKNITVHQLYYRRNQQDKLSPTVLHKLTLTNNQPASEEKEIQSEKSIKLEIGKSKIYIPQSNVPLILSIIKELNKTC